MKSRIEKIEYLIHCLKHEMPEYAKYRAGNSEREAFDLYRALCNLRTPRKGSLTMHTLPDDFYAVESDVLRGISSERGVVDAAGIPAAVRDERLSLWKGDITTLRADSVVNAANSRMLGCFVPLHSCIDNCIHTMAGVRLREKCYEMMRTCGFEEETGKAKITPGYNLPAKFVIHTVGPIVEGFLTGRDKALLASCYRSVLDLANENRLHSVAFCCISTGVFRFPQSAAAKIAVRTAREWLFEHPESSVGKIVFNVFKESDERLYGELLGSAGGR